MELGFFVTVNFIEKWEKNREKQTAEAQAKKLTTQKT